MPQLEAPRRQVLVALAALAVVGSGCSKQPEPEPPAAIDPRLRVEVDPRVELISIVCRLAGHPSYNHRVQTPYTKRVDAHFGRYRDHPAVAAMRELRRSAGISYEKPFQLAIHLDGVERLRPIVVLDPLPEGLDERFGHVPLDDLLRVLRGFAADSEFETFFAANAGFYRKTEAVYRRFAAETQALTWYDELFGERIDSPFVIVPGLLTGKMAYGASVTTADGTRTFYQVMVASSVDADGLPMIAGDQEAFLVHEMAHPFVNPAVEAHRAAFEPAAIEAYEKMRPALPQMYQGWKTVIDESVVRAIVILFVKDKQGRAAAKAELGEQRDMGFAWVVDFAVVLEALKDSGRPWTPADAMPGLVDALERWVATNAR